MAAVAPVAGEVDVADEAGAAGVVAGVEVEAAGGSALVSVGVPLQLLNWLRR